ncbi:MAG: hypothetical protein ACRD3W_13855 [Terriglobales bacterium]
MFDFRKRRNEKGSSLTEFGPALAIFIIFVIVPLLDLGVIPIRYGIAYGVLNQLTKRMGMCEKLSQANNMYMNEKWWVNDLNASGIFVSKKALSIRVVGTNQETAANLPTSAPVPTNFLPDSKSGPYYYYLQLTSTLQINPLFPMTVPWAGIPGLTGPVTIPITTEGAWENLGRDSESPTEDYFLNE